MDLDIDKIHSILVDANLPSSIKDLKNPTQEYVINLINTFLLKYYIDVSVIDKPTMEQQDAMSSFDDSDIIGLINLHVATAQICERIFLTDLSITDLTSPGSKRLRKHAKFLANFILYTTNKESDIQDRIDEIHGKVKMYQDWIDRKNEAKESINHKALEVAKLLSEKEKCINEIKVLQPKIEKNSKRYHELVSEMTATEERKQKAMEVLGDYKSTGLKLNKAIAHLKSEIVTSPEEYEARFGELEEQRKMKVKERETMQEAFQDKKQVVEQQENVLEFIRKQLDKLPELGQIYEQLKKVGVQEKDVKRQIETLETTVGEMEKKLAVQKDQENGNEINEIHSQCEDRLLSLRDLYSRLASSKKSADLKLKEIKALRSEANFETNKIQGIIKKIEDETTISLKSYQELYDNEILAESSLWNV